MNNYISIKKKILLQRGRALSSRLVFNHACRKSWFWICNNRLR